MVGASAVVLALDGGSPRAAPSLDGAAAALALAQHVASVGAAPALLLLLTCGSQAVAARGAPARVSAAAHGGAWGLARVLRLEQPSVRVLSVDAFEGDEASAARGAVMEVGARGGETQLAWRGGVRLVARLQRREAVGAAAGEGGVSSAVGPTCVLSGGLGGLGLRAAALLAARGAGGLVLAPATHWRAGGARRAGACGGASGAAWRGGERDGGAGGGVLRAPYASRLTGTAKLEWEYHTRHQRCPVRYLSLAARLSCDVRCPASNLWP